MKLRHPLWRCWVLIAICISFHKTPDKFSLAAWMWTCLNVSNISESELETLNNIMKSYRIWLPTLWFRLKHDCEDIVVLCRPRDSVWFNVAYYNNKQRWMGFYPSINWRADSAFVCEQLNCEIVINAMATSHNKQTKPNEEILSRQGLIASLFINITMIFSEVQPRLIWLMCLDEVESFCLFVLFRFALAAKSNRAKQQLDNDVCV